jgi:hypothetical protein
MKTLINRRHFLTGCCVLPVTGLLTGGAVTDAVTFLDSTKKQPHMHSASILLLPSLRHNILHILDFYDQPYAERRIKEFEYHHKRLLGICSPVTVSYGFVAWEDDPSCSHEETIKIHRLNSRYWKTVIVLVMLYGEQKLVCQEIWRIQSATFAENGYRWWSDDEMRQLRRRVNTRARFLDHQNHQNHQDYLFRASDFLDY